MTLVAIFLVVCFCTINVCPRSILPDEGLLAVQVEKQNATNVNPMKVEKVEKIVWRKLDSIPRRDIQQPQEVNTSGIAEEEDLDQLRSNQHLLEDKGQNSESSEIQSTIWSEKLETEPTPWSTEDPTFEYSDFDQNDGFTTAEDLSTNSSDNVTFELFKDISSNNFTGNVLHILNRTRDLLGLQSISEISNTTESFVFSETSDVAVFQDVTTSGFEFLIDSETTQNLLIAEMLSSESLMLADDDLNDSTNDDSLSETTHFILFQEIESFSDDSVSDINGQLVEIKTVALNMSKPENVTEIIETEARCPPPGWCVFWFMAQDTCAKDSHCLGSRICCKSGCSKTCLDVPPTPPSIRL